MNDINAPLWKLIELRRYDEARKQAQQGIAQSPENAGLYHAAAHIEWLCDEIELGLSIAEQGLGIDPAHEQLRYVFFNLLVESERYSEAEAIIADLISGSPEDADYLCAYSRLMMQTFYLEKARALCDEALRVSPDHEPAQILNHLLNIIDGKKDQAADDLAILVRNNPENERLLGLVANSLVDQKRYSEAQRVAQELIRMDPGDSDYVDMAVSLRTINHWSSWPNWPLNRFGWVASIVIWLGAIGLIRFMETSNNLWVTTFVFVYIGWVVYSWVQPPLLKKWLKHRGI
ncbi:MAG: tetratricopeptide repeat protein [Arenicella sp.]